MGRRPVTDLRLLEAIYDDAEPRYPGSSGPEKTYVPLDLLAIARKLECPADELWGRLYHVLDHNYGHVTAGGSRVPFFSPAIGDMEQCIHFPMLAGVLAGERDLPQRDRSTRGIALISAVISLVSLAWTLVRS